MPERVGLTPTPGIRISDPSKQPAATIKNAAAETSEGHNEGARRPQVPGALDRQPNALCRIRWKKRLEISAKHSQHPLGMIASRDRLDDDRLAIRVQTGEQNAGLDLSRSDRQFILDRPQSRAASDTQRCPPLIRLDPGSHSFQRLDNTSHWTPTQRIIPRKRSVEWLPGEYAGHQSHRRTAVSAVQRFGRGFQSCSPDTADHNLASRLALFQPKLPKAIQCRTAVCTRRVILDAVSPSARAASIAARCDIDLSPGNAISPRRHLAGRMIISKYSSPLAGVCLDSTAVSL
jgi:hypothetical protein